MEALLERNKWYADAFRRFWKMDNADRAAGFAGIDQWTENQTIATIRAALEAALSLAKSGQEKQAMECMEEAVVMATSIRIRKAINTKAN